MIKTTYKNCGSSWVVMLQGNFELGENEEGHDVEVEREFWSFWHHGATNGEFDWMTTTRGYFWTTREKLLKAYENKELFRMLNDADEFKKHDPEGHANACKGIKGGFLPTAKERAKEILDSLDQKSNILKFGVSYAHLYELGQVSAEVGEDEFPHKQQRLNATLKAIAGGDVLGDPEKAMKAQ